MTFREKSAWAMAALLLAAGAMWLRVALAVPGDAPPLAQLGPLIPFAMAVIVGAIVIQIVLSIAMVREVQKPADERERPLIDKAGHWSGIVLAVVVVGGIMNYLATGQGAVLFQWVTGGLILSQLAEYVFQIALFRRGR